MVPKAKAGVGPRQTAGGLFVPETSEEGQFTSGAVTHLGDWLTVGEGSADITPIVAIGQTVFFNKFTAPKIKTDEGEFYILKLDDVLAVA